MTSPNLNLSVHLDYKTRQTTATLVNPYLTGSITDTDGYLFRMYDEKGCIIQSIPMAPEPSSYHSQTLTNTKSFGLQIGGIGNGNPVGGYDSSINRSVVDGVSIGYWPTEWELSNEVAGNPFFLLATQLLENAFRDAITMDIDRRDGCYIGTPLLITDGDAVTHGIVSNVTGDTYMELTYDKSILSYAASNVGDALCEVISGANSGQTFSVRSQTSLSLSVDLDVNHLSGQLIKVMPYRTVDSYSGWVYTGSTASAMGDGGIRAKFGLDADIPAGPGSLHYLSGTYSGLANVAHPFDISASAIFTASVVSLVDDPYLRQVSAGDVVYFTPASAPSAESTGVILSVAEHGVPAEGDYAITYWPEEAPTSSSEFKIFRTNNIDLQSYPELDRDYLCVARSSLSVVNTGEQAVTIVRTPSVEVDFAANEFESVFPVIPESSHFHIGPVYLSNGQTLLDDGVGSNGVLPILHFSGLVTNGDPEAPATILNSKAFSTQRADAAHKFAGMYYKDGVMTMAATTTFNASETIICKAVINYGSIQIDKIFTIPVQPSV
jgi:hypothetical protein